MSTIKENEEKRADLNVLPLLNGSLLGVQTQPNSTNISTLIAKQSGLPVGTSTKTTGASESSTGMPKYTPGRTAASSNVEYNATPPKAQTYTVNAGNQPYVDQLNSLYDQIMNRKPFQYDLNSDLLYKQMADQYTQMGQQAMMDTMGQAAALTGGYGNSYAQSVGNQTYQQYMTGLSEQIPSLYDRALNAYMAEGDRMLQQYELAAAHPGYVDSIKPQTYTVTQSDDSLGEMQYVQDVLSALGGGLYSGYTPSNIYRNSLYGWYNNPENKK